MRAPRRDSLIARWSGPVAIAVTAAALLCWTWGTWPDVLVDYGQQLWLAWQLAEGKVLYRDLAYYNGPLSLHANAALFRLFGVGLRTLVAGNLVLLALLVALLHHAFGATGGRGSATTACLTFLLLFAFAQYVGIGNYNYVCPYSHEMTHGLLLGLAALACAWRSRQPARGWLVASGACLGLAFLTKAEVFLAGAAATTLAVGFKLGEGRAGPRAAMADAGSFLAAFLTPPVGAFALLASAMPARQALIGTVGSWIGVFNVRLVNLPFFREGTGLDDIPGNLRTLLAWAGIYTLIAIPGAVAGLVLPTSRAVRYSAAVVAFVVVLVVVLRDGPDLEWAEAMRPLPLIMLGVGIASVMELLRARKAGRDTEAAMRRLTLAVFALLLMGKMILKARIYHYGFVAAMPATLILVTLLLHGLPAAIDRAGGSGAVLRASVLAALLVFVTACLGRQASWLAAKVHRVGSGSDAFWADGRGPFVNAALRAIDGQLPRGAMLLALPEGIMLNYLGRRPTPTRYTNFMPTEMAIFGEAPMFEAVRSRPADAVALVHKDTGEFDARFFGRDYGRPFLAWVDAHYSPFAGIGAEPLKTGDFGILLLTRRADHAVADHFPQARQDRVLVGAEWRRKIGWIEARWHRSILPTNQPQFSSHIIRNNIILFDR